MVYTAKPVIGFSVDFEKYKKERESAFGNIKARMPCKIIKTQAAFFPYLYQLYIQNSPIF